jgi:hypothetical protein
MFTASEFWIITDIGKIPSIGPDVGSNADLLLRSRRIAQEMRRVASIASRLA